MKNHSLLRLIVRFSLLVITAMFCQVLQAQPFVHPGGLHTQTDFLRMSNKVAQASHPWIDSYNQLTPIWMANLNMPWAPVTQIIRGPTGSNYARSQKDALGIYYHALRYWITGNTNYAEEAIRGMDLWSSTMTNGVGGDSNWALGAGICGYEFAVAGEALRGYPNWSQTSINNYKSFLKLFADGNDSFLVSHNGTCDSHYWCNWDACNAASLMACGVFRDDTNEFNRAVTYIKQGKGNGNLTSAAWFIHPDGLAQWQESGRDQAHTMDGIAWLGVACQVAWNQGVDLYGFDNNRFWRGLEYSAKYNLWNDMPFASYSVCEGASFNWGTTALNAGSRGFLPPTWDMFYNHYANVLGMSAPWTAQAAALLRPDGFYNNANSPDFVGFTTLTCLQDPVAAGAIPGGLEASASAHTANLTWFGSTYATSYNVKRATTSGGPYTTIATVGTVSIHYIDAGLTSGTTYYYVVSANNPGGESANSSEVTVSVGPTLVAQLKFDESSGTTAADSSGNGWNGTLVGGPTWVVGQYGNAVGLNGSSQYVALPPGVVAGVQDFTISAWVYLNTVNTWARLFDFGADTDRYMFLAPSSGGANLRFAITKFGGAGEQQVNAPALTAGAWHHVAVTLQGSGSAGSGVGLLYLDGVPVGTNSSMSYYPDMIGSLINDNNNYIGKSQFADPYLNGSVDDFRIYGGALNAAAISAVMANNPLPAPPAAPAAPSAPTGLTATPVSSSQINLSWTASSGATSYNLKRSTTSGGPYVILNNLTSTSFKDTGLTDGTTYYYVVTALNDGGESANSTQASATPPVPNLVNYWKFDETSGTTAADSVGGQSGTLNGGATWAAGISNNAVSLNGSSQYVSFPAGFVSTLNDCSIAGWFKLNSVSTWARLFDFGSGTSTYMYLVPSSGSAIRFSITTNSGAGEQQINGSAIPSTGVWHHFAVTFSGSVGTLYVDGIRAGINSGMTLDPSTLGSTTLNYIGKSQYADPYLNGSVDDFRIYDGALSASEVAVLAGVAQAPPAPPAAPTSLGATAGNAVVNLSWTQSTSPGITGNNIYRSTSGSGGPYNLLANLAATTSYSDTAVANGSTYYYSVTAVNANGESALSAYAGATPQPPPPAAPAGLTAAPGDSQVALSWTASSGATSYNVYSATVSGGPYTLIASGVASTGYTDTTAVNGTTYYYVVTAVNGGGESAYSNEANATPIAALLAYLKFNEASGTTASDSTGNGWNGTLVGGPTWVVGQYSNAVSLSGTNQYVSLPAGLVSSLTNFTISVWVKPTTVSSWNRVFDFGNNTTTYMFLTPKGSTGKVRFAITTSGNTHEQQINGTAVLSAGAWSHVVVTLNGSTGTLYVNGTVVGTNSGMTLTPSSLGSTSNNYLGKSQFNDPYLKGLVDEFRIYKGALTAAQVSALP